jgi:DNA repair exonuclease SbcCD ATPase subunit
VERVKQQVEEQFSAVRREREALRNELQARRQQVLVLERRIAQLSQQVQQQAQSLQALAAARAQAEQGLEASRKRLAVFEQDPLAKQISRLQQRADEVPDLQQALKAQEHTSRQLNQQLAQSLKQVATLNERVTSRGADLSRLERELSAVKSEQSRLKKENRQLTRAAERAGRKPWEGFERLFGQSRHSVHAGKGLFAMDQASVQQVLARARDQVEQLADAVEDRDQIIAELQTALAEQERRLEQAEAVIALLEGRPE